MSHAEYRFKMIPEVPAIADPELKHLSRLIRNPLTGAVYRRRFDMVLELIDGNPSTILEIGYGAGFLTYTLAPLAARYLAIDIHDEHAVVSEVLSRLGRTNVELSQADARDLNNIASGTVDAVVSVSCLEHIREREAVQREVARILRPGGQAVYGVPVKNALTKALFRLIGYDDEAIHPSEPRGILAAAVAVGLIPERDSVFPASLGMTMGLYWAARFRRI